jgi:hypothetical protein
VVEGEAAEGAEAPAVPGGPAAAGDRADSERTHSEVDEESAGEGDDVEARPVD